MTSDHEEVTPFNEFDPETDKTGSTSDLYYAPAISPTSSQPDANDTPASNNETLAQPHTLATLTPSNTNFTTYTYPATPLYGPMQNGYVALPKRSRWRPTLLTLLGLLLVVLGTGTVVWVLKDASFRDQQAVAATTQVTAIAQAVSEAQDRVTSTVQAQNLATATAANIGTATAQAPATAQAQILQATVGPLEQKADKLFSSSGQLVIKSTAISLKYADVSVRDAIIKSKFINPADSSYHKWDYGFGFRGNGSNKEFRLFMVYGGYWELELTSGTKSGTTNSPIEIIISDGYVTNMNLEASGSNTMALYIKGEKAEFYVNDKFVATLNLSSKMLRGNVFVGTGFKSVDEMAGQVIHYEDFSVASLDDKNTSI